MKLVFLALGLLTGLACRSGEASGPEVTEVAVSRIKPEFVTRMPSLMRDIREKISRYDGFISMQSLAAGDTSRVFIDVLRWQSKAHAEKAFEDFHKTEECRLLLGAIEKDIYFGHLSTY